ncbi:MAG: hypothetical protein LBB84_12165 [Tannerellaceae bacterium]|jgi:hypothetical protein|nr:hypothetical protein [Tannerellaceae bacterium]
MNKKMDYIPEKDSALALWSANFTAGVAANAATWSIPESEVIALKTAEAAFIELEKQAYGPTRNSVIVSEKNAARKTLEGEIRRLTGFRLKNPIITNADRIELGLHVRNTKPSNIPAPKSHPEFSIDLLDFRRLKIRYKNMDSESRAKPYGVNGAVIAYDVLDVPPVRPTALSRTLLATRTPHTLEFVEEERGKTVYVAVCWQNEKGEKGPWSRIERAIVP